MPFQSDLNHITWKIHLNVPPEVVYAMLSTNDGRAQFWAESALELDKHIHFVFTSGQKWRGKILEAKENALYKVQYYGGSTATFHIETDKAGGSILTLTDEDVPQEDRSEVTAGWVSVLMALKAALEFGVDLRNHDTRYTWESGFADN